MKRLWNSSLLFKFLLTYLLIVALLLAGFFLYSSSLLRNLYVTSLAGRMEREARLLGVSLPAKVEGAALDAICRTLADRLGARITIIATDGRVLGDSAESSATMENHRWRPEIVEAIASGTGSAVRYSTTVRHDLLYRAFLDTTSSEKRILRVAIPLKDIDQVTDQLRRRLLTGLLTVSVLGLLMASFFSRRFSRRVMRLVDFSRTLAGGSFPRNFFPPRAPDEIHLLEQNLNEMSAKIHDNIRQIVAEKEKLDSILRCMIEGVLVLDPKGRVLLINERAQSMFHVPREQEIHGASITELSRHPEMRRVLREVLAFDFSSDRYSKEVELDEGRWFRVNAVSLTDGEHQVLGSVLVFHDVTEIKRFEMLRADFVANVSHELRTPLTAIRGYVETLIRTPPAEPVETQQFLGIIERHSERLSRLTEDLLTLSDLESGRVQIANEPVDVTDLIDCVLEVFWDRASKKCLQIVRDVEPGVAPVLGDFDRLQQLLINLVDNAVKYTPFNGRITVTARHTSRSDGEPGVEIAVADTGPGIPEADLPRLTERFYRVDKARSRDLGGTGLGLAIVKHIVQAHKGELRFESAVQKGTTVRVILPAAAGGSRYQTILFMCTANSCRSQMAEGFARQHLRNGNGARVFSAGTDPKEVHPLAIQVMREAGIDISDQRAKHLSAVPLDQVDLLVTLCGEALEICSNVSGAARRVHWPLPDPASAHGDHEQVLSEFRRVRDEIRSRVIQLLAC